MTLVDLADLSSALDLGVHEHVAVVGGGGKTTLVHALGRQLTGNRILTTTTKMGFDQHSDLPVRLLSDGNFDPAEVGDEGGIVVVWGAIDEPVALGVDPTDCDAWFPNVDHVIVEADGARRRPFKAPAHYEPVVPSSATMIVSTIGIDAIDAVIEERCHRPDLVARLAGCRPTDRLTPELAAHVLTHEDGNRRALPSGARLVVAITKVEDGRAAGAEKLSAILAERAPDIGRVIVRNAPN